MRKGGGQSVPFFSRMSPGCAMTFSGGMKMGQGHGVSGRHPQSAKEVHACAVGLEPGLAEDGSQGSLPSFKSMAFSTTSRAAGIAVEGGWCLLWRGHSTSTPA